MKPLFTLIAILNCLHSFAQTPDWLWADNAGGNSVDRGQCVYTDPSTGDVVIAGFYQSAAISFGSITLNNTVNNLTSDIFVAKYNSAGNVLWAKTYGNTGLERANGVAVDLNGNIIVTGYFESQTIAFGSTTLTSSGGINCFILKLDAAGNEIWVRQSTGNQSEYGTNVAVDNVGDIVVGGYFKSSTFSFGTVSASIIGANSEDIFVVKYNAAGNGQWLNVAGGTKLEDLQGIAVDSNNDIIISGGFTSAVLNAGTSTLTNFQVNTYDAFIIKYTSGGGLSWVNSLGGYFSENAMNVTTDINDNIFITGYFETLSLPIGTTTLTNTSNGGFLDIFTAKLNPLGVFQWAASIGGITDDYGSDVSTDASGNVFMSGYFDSNTMSVGSSTLTNNGVFDIVIAKYDNSGSLLWVNSAGGGGSDRAESIITNNTGEAYLTGFFGSSTIAFGTTVLNNASDNDIFIAKLEGTTGLISAQESYDWIDIYSPNNNGAVYIHSEHPISLIEITNLTGQQVLFELPNTNVFETRLKIPGVYFIRALSNQTMVKKKVTILH
jgi:hypothetical protein